MQIAEFSRSLRGNVDRNVVHKVTNAATTRRSLRGNVDRNGYSSTYNAEYMSRSLRGNVDRNFKSGATPTTFSMSFPTWERG